ncbi:hypothetical protein PHYBLDRAFT_164129 [Phycomyces blakesleeanus NRRL 1555(-)]|uniref:Transposase domain-containing protein n=1 Tax=Phycomyces blakesleeanus (strain ATCC 8743b / DSM 1359 / FGSC 10004 / NBRC 33097 / NRRL 1555) TaxID=763407 RepID=A0A167Q495_PHYB8|nr:hypothetical protein PHYBLDRAFT_164129 [Phycomyces blakesleeanus NRRL 1555(-)]OAD79047.1 hypothetical protein PHYBLDRAFT_164129 [Phycomyces blakesleeanus NRRL 1555(-)]|eukprot:XP_018297087.1 hypothetical protein PHYBLDRAFT_164129 [Phycomyces blakesleeanus NRRL 1555(-)]
MNSTTKIYTVMCTCSSCTKNAISRILQNAQTFKCHNNADKLLDIGPKNRVNTEVIKEETDVERVDVSETSIDYEDNYSIISAETTIQSVPFLREDQIFQFEESDVETTSLASDNDDPDSSDESEDESKVEVAGVEDFEDMVASEILAFVVASLKIHEMSQTSQFMALFGVIFQAFYLVQAGRTAMLKFFCHLLVAFDKDTDLPLTIDVLKTMTDFNFMTKSIVKYTVCNKCFAIYLPGNRQPNCTFEKYTTTLPTYCGNPLFSDTKADRAVPLMVFPYNLLKNALAQHFAKPGFEHQIENATEAEMWFCAESDAERAVLEKQHGTHFSELHCLHYFDPFRCTIVDPMHNLFLGTAKRMISVWKDLRYLPTAVLIRMQRLADGILVPPGYAILSTKIESGFPYMKADEWQSWCLIYSLVVLKDALPEDDYKNWTLFVKACRKLTGPSVTYSEIDSAYQLLREFGKECETLYGESSITPNMHLHMHLRESMLNFGPVYAFWLYSFKRYNGKLKNIKTNCCNGLEVTFMRVFLEKAFIGSFLRAYSTNLSSPLIEFLEGVAQVKSNSDSSSPLNLDAGHPPALPFSLAMFQQAATNPWYNVTGSEALPPTTLPIKLQPLTMMKDDYYQWLFEFYVKAYQSTSVSFCVVGRIPIGEDVFVNNRIQKVKKISLLGQEYCSGEKKKRGSFVRVLFLERTNDNVSEFPGQIEYLFTYTIKIGGVKRVSTFAFIKWFPAYHSSSHQPLADQGLQSWDKGFMEEDASCIVPVHHLHSCFALTTHKMQSGTQKHLVIPLPRKVVT